MLALRRAAGGEAGGGAARELAGDPAGARDRYARSETVERPADPDCLMASGASGASGHHPQLE